MTQVLTLSEQYAKQHGDAAPEHLSEAIRPLLFGYETDCNQLDTAVRKLVAETGVSQ
jgi:hypothetical protein